MEAGDIADYARDHGLDMTPAVVDGDDCVKLLRSGDWVADAQAVTL